MAARPADDRSRGTGSWAMDVDPVAVLRRRQSAKWSTFDDDVLPLPVAEMDLPLAPPIVEALSAAVRRSDAGYVPPASRLPEALAGFAVRRWGWEIDPARVTVVPDVGAGVVEALRLLSTPGDAVVVSSPVYPPFFAWPDEVGGRLVDVPLRRDPDRWRLDLDGLAGAFAAGAGAYLLCSPHNPVGVQHPPEDLRALAELAAAHGVAVIADEIHAPLTLPGSTFTPFLTVSDAARACGVSVLSASKGWNVAGLKCAQVVTADRRLAEAMRGVRPSVHFRTGLFGLFAGVAAYEDGEPWLDDALRLLDHNRRLLAALVADRLPGVGYEPPEATYLAWLDLRALGWGDDPAERILTGARVALSPGPGFGPAGAGHARLNFGCSPDVVCEAVERIGRLVAGG